MINLSTIEPVKTFVLTQSSGFNYTVPSGRYAQVQIMKGLGDSSIQIVSGTSIITALSSLPFSQGYIILGSGDRLVNAINIGRVAVIEYNNP